MAHPFGTDESGRDVLAMSLQAMRVSFTIAALAALVAVAIGVGVGMIAGTLGGWVNGVWVRQPCCRWTRCPSSSPPAAGR
jgi:peptide/nickel transport system permease protein